MIDEKWLIEQIECLRVTITGLRIGSGIKNEYTKHVVDSIIQMINEQPKAGEWIPVSERLPEDNQIVLTSKNNSISILKYHADTKHWYETN